MRFFLDVHVRFTFARIRDSRHPRGDDLIAVLYELLFLQQKTALSLSRLLERTAGVQGQKGSHLLHLHEVEAIQLVDTLVTYLKATVEKTLTFVGLVHSIENLDAKKTHRAKLSALTERIPPAVQATAYYAFLLTGVQPERLARINGYRTGLLHKKGISSLQPHAFVGVSPRDNPLKEHLIALRDQHADNTALLLAALAILTDELARLDPPSPPEVSYPTKA